MDTIVCCLSGTPLNCTNELKIENKRKFGNFLKRHSLASKYGPYLQRQKSGQKSCFVVFVPVAPSLSTPTSISCTTGRPRRSEKIFERREMSTGPTFAFSRKLDGQK